MDQVHQIASATEQLAVTNDEVSRRTLDVNALSHAARGKTETAATADKAVSEVNVLNKGCGKPGLRLTNWPNAVPKSNRHGVHSLHL